MSGTKVCIGCGLEKDLERFHLKADAPDGHQARCKECRRAPGSMARAPGLQAVRDAGPLRALLEQTAREHDIQLKDLTVLEKHRDPFRLDTPAGHRDGEWLATTAARLGLGGRKIHLRGLHYMILGQARPDGTPYENTDKAWEWLQKSAGKAARWLGYVPFDQITDQRNAEPVVRVFSQFQLTPWVSGGTDIEVPDADEVMPAAHSGWFEGNQLYHLVMIGEKSSLEPVLAPLAEEFSADLYLPTGEISDTLIHRIAETSAQDGRPLVVLYFADCDPAGHQMIVSVSRKLQAMKVLLPKMPDFAAYRAALTPEQVAEYGLPSTPLKETEKRADRWREAFGIEQTEIDALAALRPDLLRQIARDAVAPFFDATLTRRVDEARSRWLADAQQVVEDTLGEDELDRLREQAEEKLNEIRRLAGELDEEFTFDADDYDLPDIEIPAAEPDQDEVRLAAPLIDSRWDFADQTQALIDSKRYADGGTS
jgi:hypothetical protein